MKISDLKALPFFNKPNAYYYLYFYYANYAIGDNCFRNHALNLMLTGTSTDPISPFGLNFLDRVKLKDGQLATVIGRGQASPNTKQCMWVIIDGLSKPQSIDLNEQLSLLKSNSVNDAVVCFVLINCIKIYEEELHKNQYKKDDISSLMSAIKYVIDNATYNELKLALESLLIYESHQTIYGFKYTLPNSAASLIAESLIERIAMGESFCHEPDLIKTALLYFEFAGYTEGIKNVLTKLFEINSIQLIQPLLKTPIRSFANEDDIKFYERRFSEMTEDLVMQLSKQFKKEDAKENKTNSLTGILSKFWNPIEVEEDKSRWVHRKRTTPAEPVIQNETLESFYNRL